MKIIVLNRVDYQEKDTIIDAISEEGSISFKIRGGQDPKNALARLNNPLTVADVEYTDNSRYVNKIVKGAVFIDSPLKTGNVKELASIEFICDILTHMLQKEERHLMFNDVLEYMKATKDNPGALLAKLIFLNKAVRLSGSELVTDHCVLCGATKDIVSFSFVEGGFVCRKCLTPDTVVDLNTFQMKLLRSVCMRESFEDLPEDRVPLEDKRVLLIKLTDYVRDGIGVYLDSVKFILDNL